MQFSYFGMSRHFVTARIVLLNLRPLRNSNFHFFVILKYAKLRQMYLPSRGSCEKNNVTSLEKMNFSYP